MPSEVERRREAVRQEVSIDAPMTVDLSIAEATDAPEIERRVRTALREAQDRMVRQIQAGLVSESGAVSD